MKNSRIELFVPTSYTEKYLKSFEEFFIDDDFEFILRCEPISLNFCKKYSDKYSGVSINDSPTDEYPYELFCRSWENSFRECDNEKIRKIFVNDIVWKIKTDKLFPYHLIGDNYEQGMEKISALLQKTDDSLLTELRCSNGFYLLKLKYHDELMADCGKYLRLMHGGDVLYESDTVDLVLTRIKHTGDKIEICGYLQSPVFDYCDKPMLFCKNNDAELFEIDLYESSWCYDGSKQRNNTAWGFRITFSDRENISVSFKISVCSNSYDAALKFGEWVAFNSGLGRYEYVSGTKRYKITDGKISITEASAADEKKYKLKSALSYIKKNKKVFAVRMMNLLMPKKKIWLYHDCKGVGRDNAYYQFIHDFDKNDGVERYYVVNGSITEAEQYFTDEQKNHLLVFRSNKHKLMYLMAEKIITAYIEKVNYLPFFDDAYPHYIDLFSGEVIYLQHGILHAHLPWKYSYDRLDLSYEVISSEYEKRNFCNNYCFPVEALIKSKMPRYDFTDSNINPTENRIIFAPSWRKYLISLGSDGNWITDRDKFINSDYFRETNEFLNSKELGNLLEDKNWYLDYKPHPIFARYNDCYKIDNPRISIKDSADAADYKICITDYSSYVFDFVYLQRAVVYFIPDYSEFKAGMNDYRELDIPLEDGFGELTQKADDAIEAVKKIIANDGKPLGKYAEKNNGFFFNNDKNCRDKIYEALK
ncbi:MAG: CDP-glycerol glycerophosphotransferase family protein [Clostridia bacterium]|nr:CDP-glycerol glycerophosphotransferase family protein [Clostridia bacterium]